MPAPVPNGPGICPRCSQRVLWTTTSRNAVSQAVDPEPNARGNQAVYCDGVGRWRSRQLDKDRPVPEHNEVLHMPHVATCTARVVSSRTARARPGRRAPYGRGAVVLPFRRR